MAHQSVTGIARQDTVNTGSDERGADRIAPGTPPVFTRALDFLGLERNVALNIAAGSLEAIGVGLWAGYLVKVLDAMGAAGWMIGFYGTVGGLMAAVAPYPGGLLSDRLGRGRALIVASGLSLAGFGIYLVAPTWWYFIPGAVLLSFAGNFRFMGSTALVSDRIGPRRRTTSLAVGNVIGRLPGIISPPLGGALIAFMVARSKSMAPADISEDARQTLGLLSGFRWAMGITIVLVCVAILLQRRYYKLPPARQDSGPMHPIRVFRSMRGDIKRLLLADCVVRIGSGLHMFFVPLYVLNVLERGYVEMGSLLSLMTATSVIMYIPAAKLADRTGQGSRRPIVGTTFLFFAAFPLALVLAPSAIWLIGVFVIAGLREFGEPARKALIMDLAGGGDGLGRRIGAYYMARGIAVFPAAFLGGLLWGWKPEAPFVIGGLVSAAGLVWFVLERVLFVREVR